MRRRECNSVQAPPAAAAAAGAPAAALGPAMIWVSGQQGCEAVRQAQTLGSRAELFEEQGGAVHANIRGPIMHALGTHLLRERERERLLHRARECAQR